MDQVAILIVAVFVLILSFILLRQLVLWYWKVTKIVEILQGINDKLSNLVDSK